ncbi:MAG: hypothetical protein RR293_08095, partial [Bacteroidales bacterium]
MANSESIEFLSDIFNTQARKRELQKLVVDENMPVIHLQGLYGSATALVFSSLKDCGKQLILVANDADEAGYLYHDITQI